MLAQSNFNRTGPEIPRIRIESFERYSMQVENHRNTEAEGSTTACHIFDHVKDAVELANRVFCFLTSFAIGVFN